LRRLQFAFRSLSTPPRHDFSGVRAKKLSPHKTATRESEIIFSFIQQKHCSDFGKFIKYLKNISQNFIRAGRVL